MSQVVAPPAATQRDTIAATEPLDVPSESDCDDIGANQVVARSQVGTAFYLFNHQAGGHKPFLRSAAGEVCKPVIPLELQFYQSLDSKYPQLKSFVPPFVGVITVDLHPLTPAEEVANVAMETVGDDGQGDGGGNDEQEEADDEEEGEEEEEEETTCSSASGDEYKAEETSTATAVVDSQISFDTLQLQSPTNSSTATTVAVAGTAAVMPMTPTGLTTKKRRQRGSSNRQTRSSSSASTSYSAKLWKKERSKAQYKSSLSSSCSQLQQQQQQSHQQQQHHQQRNASTLSRSVSLSREYLVLGDLTHKYSHPCVLDMKMGTRQHGEDAPPAKARSHSLKCASTTSLALGLRICGMQIYDQVEQRYTLWDKHWGRQLTQDDVEQALVTVRWLQ